MLLETQTRLGYINAADLPAESKDIFRFLGECSAERSSEGTLGMGHDLPRLQLFDGFFESDR